VAGQASDARPCWSIKNHSPGAFSTRSRSWCHPQPRRKSSKQPRAPFGRPCSRTVIEFDLLGNGDAVLGDPWRAPRPVEHDIAAFRAQRDTNRMSEDVNVAQHLVARVDRKSNLFGSHCLNLYVLGAEASKRMPSPRSRRSTQRGERHECVCSRKSDLVCRVSSFLELVLTRCRVTGTTFQLSPLRPKCGPALRAWRWQLSRRAVGRGAAVASGSPSQFRYSWSK
jgi:hypothetical protein